MKIKRYNTINALGQGMELKEIEFKEKEYTAEYQVDDSHFQPISETLKTMGNSGALTEQEIQQYYDFPSGQDNGMNIPIDRTHGDLADISEEIKKQGRKTKKAIQEAIEEKETQDKIEKYLGTTQGEE